ncbi:MAG: RES family NAD+ phosphorylase [Bacteroidetes bacterium]|nr:RES family NAD+ phosphorylase [Bacteroidota bacterium]
MKVFRLFRAKHKNPLSASGASIKGARWNSIGIELLYTAGNRSLAMAEVAVHLTLATLPIDYMMAVIYIPDDIAIQEVDISKLPPNWRNFPHTASTQKWGDDFVKKSKYCVLKIPSAVTKGDYNYLINPKHKDFAKIKVLETDKFPFDNRIFKGGIK